MSTFTRNTIFTVLLFAGIFLQRAQAQSVLNPADPVVTYNPSSTPAQPAWGQIGKWVRTLKMSWNTDNFKAYIYKGMPFRMHFPKTYNPTATDGKRYPILVFFHGKGEADTSIYDNEYQLLLGHQFFESKINSGEFDGYTLSIQSSGGFGISQFTNIKEILDYMIVNNKLDPFQIVVNGLSSGGQGSWEMMTNYPTYIAAALPMSWASLAYNDQTIINNVKSKPIWVFHGSLDGNPAPGTVYQVRDAYLAAGANFKNTEYPYQEHNSWDKAWSEPDFFPYINRAYLSNPWPLGGKYDFFPGEAISATLTLTPGLEGYEWRKDGVTITGATSNTLNATALGVYDARVKRNGLWSEWSRIPVTLKMKSYVTLPTRIEAESWNYMDGIQNEGTTDVGGGQDVGYIDFGNWMDYNINVPSAGTYTLKLRVATPQTSGQLQVKTASGTVLATVNVPRTGGWQTWQTLTTTVNFTSASYQRIRILATGPESWNINWLEFTQGGTPNQPPSVSAGSEKTITLPTNFVQLNGTATDADGTITEYNWSQVAGPTQAAIGTPTTSSTTVSNLTAGTYTFRFYAIDNSGAKVTSDVYVNVSDGTTAFNHIEAERWLSMFGVQTENTSDAGGGQDVGWIDLNDYMDYRINVPTAGAYTLKFRVASQQTGGQFRITNDNWSLQSIVDVPNTGGWQNWQTITITANLPAGPQNVRITSTAASGWNLNWWEFTSTTGTTNQPPTVSAGANQTITLPANSVNLSGTASDPDGTIASYSWSKVSGPAGETITSPSAAATSVTGLVQGTYLFRLTVKDNGGATATSDVTVTVNGATTNQPPTVNAGTDQTITLPTASVQLSGTATDADGTIASYSWSQVAGPSQATLSAPTQAQTTASNLVQGTYTFRLTVKDDKGAASTDDIVVTVNGSTSTGGSLKIEAETYTTMSGIQTETTADAGGGLNVGYIDLGDWMDYSVNVPSTGGYTVNFRVATQQTGGQFQLKNTSGTVLATVSVPNTGGWQTWTTVSAQVSLTAGLQTLRISSTTSSNWNINWFELISGTYTPPPPPPTSKVEAETYTIMQGVQTEGTSDIGGGLNVGYIDLGDWMDYNVNVGSTGTYTINFRVASQQTGGQFQLKNASGTVLATVNVPNTAGWQNWTTVSATVNLTQGQQTLRLASTSSAGWNINWFELVLNSGTTNQAPTANAGANQTITLPTSTVTLNGSGTDPDGTITAYNWTKVSGPAGSSFSSTTTATTTVSGLVQGTYVFRLTVTDNGGATATSDVTVTVNGATTTNQPPTVSAGSNQTITLPTNYVNLSGTASDPDGSIASYAWTKVSGPAGESITSPSSAATSVSGLVQGSYVFRLTVTDNSGATASSDVTITVNAAPVQNVSLKIEAESYATMSGVQTTSTSDVGGGQCVTSLNQGDWMDYTVNVPYSGPYTVNFRVASLKSSNQLQLRNASGTVLGTINATATGGAQTWTTISTSVTLAAGQQTLRVYANKIADVLNFNWWEIVYTGGTTGLGARISDPVANLVPETLSESLEVYPNPAQGQVTLQINNAHTGKMKVQIVNMSGAVQKEYSFQKSNNTERIPIALGNLAGGQYLVVITMDGYKETRRLQKL